MLMRSGLRGSMSTLRSRVLLRVRRLSWLRKWSQFWDLGIKKVKKRKKRIKVGLGRAKRKRIRSRRWIDKSWLVWWRRKSSSISLTNKSDLSWKTRSRFILLKGSFLGLRLSKRLLIINRLRGLWVCSSFLLILRFCFKSTRRDLIHQDRFKKKEPNLLCKELLESKSRNILRKLLSLMKGSSFTKTRFLKRTTKTKNIKDY